MKQLITRLSIIFLFFLSGSLNESFAQELPKIIPPAPVSEQFQKFLGYPISPATGAADISIPLYELHATGLNIPFNLKYHSSGIKVDDSPGQIGYGWTLFPGFRITRTVMGKPDDYAKTDDIRDETQVDGQILPYLQSIYVCSSSEWGNNPANIDGQFDIYTIHLPTFNTTFVLKWVNGILKGITLPNSSIKITPVYRSPSEWKFFYFEVTDDKGIRYIFGQDHYNRTQSYYGEDLGTTEWMLEKIIAPGTANEINFSYKNSIDAWYTVNDSPEVINDQKAGSPGGGGGFTEDDNDNYMNTFGRYGPMSTLPSWSYNTWALDIISFASGRMKFSYTDQNKNRLSSISVFNNGNGEVKRVDFSRSDDYLLNTVSITGEGQYSFEYDMQPFTYPRGQDFSGYYNGQNNGT